VAYTTTGCVTHAGPRNRRNTSARCLKSDFFLCHAWDRPCRALGTVRFAPVTRLSRSSSAKNDIGLGTHRSFANRQGIGEVESRNRAGDACAAAPLRGESIADKELSVLLAREQLVPVVHGTTYEALREISPLLASRNGLNTLETRWLTSRPKLAELIAL